MLPTKNFQSFSTMQHNTFEGSIDGLDIQFQFNRLKFRQTEQVLGLIEDFKDLGDTKKQIAALRQAVSICVAGWSLEKPIDSWDGEIEVADAVKLVARCLQGNSASEGDRKK